MNIRQIIVPLVIVSLLITAGCSTLTGTESDNGTNDTNGTTAAEKTPTPTATATPTPTMTPTPTATAMPTTQAQTESETMAGTSVAIPSGTNNGQHYLDVFRTTLRRSNISVVSLEMQGDTTILRYVSSQTTQTGIATEISTVARAYAGTVSQGWAVDRLSVTIVVPSGEPVAAFYIKSSWARQYINGELSTEEFLRLIFGTAEEPTTTTPAPTAVEMPPTQVQTGTETTTGTSVVTPSGSLTDTPSGTNNDQYYLDVFGTTLRQSNISVVSLETQGNTVVLRYASSQTTPYGLGSEIGVIAGAYADIVSQGWAVDRLSVTIVSRSGEPAGTFYVESSWARRYINGELSAEEFIRLIAGTIEATSGGGGTTTSTQV